MIWILLLIQLTSCVCGTLVVTVTQSSYQAEENHNITLGWNFTPTIHSFSNIQFISCLLLTEQKPSVLYQLHEGVEVPESQDKQFSGRVHCDKDVLREGRIRLNVSRLRTEDSGLYRCDVETTDGLSSDRCRLNVTGPKDTDRRRVTEVDRSDYWSQVKMGFGAANVVVIISAGLMVLLGAAVTCVVHCLRMRSHRSHDGRSHAEFLMMLDT